MMTTTVPHALAHGAAVAPRLPDQGMPVPCRPVVRSSLCRNILYTPT